MNTHADKTKENKSKSIPNNVSQKWSNNKSNLQFVSNNSEVFAIRELQELANNSPQVKQAIQLQAIANNHLAQQSQIIQKKENNTGLPDNLKEGIENLSGYSMDDIKVHYNSDKPAQLQAHAYAQGTNIHISSGKEKHLPHEAWHVVQQKQGRVKSNIQLKGGLNLNDDVELEKEADIMGVNSLSHNYTTATSLPNDINNTQLKSSNLNNVVQAYKFKTPKEMKDKLSKLNTYTASESDSIYKEFPSWYQKTKGDTFKNHDFIDDNAFLDMIKEMIKEIDDFTDLQGFELRDRINSSDNGKVFLGFNAGNAAYADDMVKNGLKSKKKDSGLKANMQLSHGHYITPIESETISYIAERHAEGKDAIVYKVYLDLEKIINFPIMMKGASVKQWWGNYDTSFDDNYDIVIAALSGHTDIIQYKINPKSYHIISFEIHNNYPKPKVN